MDAATVMGAFRFLSAMQELTEVLVAGTVVIKIAEQGAQLLQLLGSQVTRLHRVVVPQHCMCCASLPAGPPLLVCLCHTRTGYGGGVTGRVHW